MPARVREGMIRREYTVPIILFQAQIVVKRIFFPGLKDVDYLVTRYTGACVGVMGWGMTLSFMVSD